MRIPIEQRISLYLVLLYAPLKYALVDLRQSFLNLFLNYEVLP